MFSIKEMHSPSSLFSAYASMTASIMLLRSMANDLIPSPIRDYLFSTLLLFFKPRSEILSLFIEESIGMELNELYDASESYLSTRITPDILRLKISKTPKQKNFTIGLEKSEQIVDFFDGVELKWTFEAERSKNPNYEFADESEKRWFQLSFHKEHRDMVFGSYLPSILEKAKAIRNEEKILKMFTLNKHYALIGGNMWEAINFDHPANFETLAMDLELRTALMEDLNRFVKRREFYKRVGRAWKRGYLLYGPPGTGKSSLVAAMANYLKFDIYDLQLSNVWRDSDLRNLLLSTGNKSILVIEDIDRSFDLPDRRNKDGSHLQFITLSGLLNIIDGLWSSCGDERIIIFTTNHKDELDPALLRPGRMDMHIHMSYCNPQGFKILASNYLGIHGDHHLFDEIEGLLKITEVTSAQVAEELMKSSEDPNIALEGLLKLLKRKKLEGDEPMGKYGKRSRVQQAKGQKVETKHGSVRISKGKGSRRRKI